MPSPTPVRPRRRSTVESIAGILLCAATTAALAQGAADPSIWTPLDTARLRFVGQAKISPDGRHVAYTVSVPIVPGEEKSGIARTELHVMLPNGRTRPFVSGDVRVSSIGWTPHGDGISFLAQRGADKAAALWVIPSDGGEAQKVLAPAGGIQEYSFAPDGRSVAVIVGDEPAAEAKKLVEDGFDQVIVEEGFLPVRVLIATLGADAPAPRALELPGVPSEIRWEPNGQRIALAVAPTPLVDDSYMSRRVHIVDSASGAVLARFENPGKLGPMAWSPDGAHLAFISAEDLNDPSAGRLIVAPSSGGDQRRLPLDVEGDYDEIAWKDARTIAYLASIGTTTRFGEVAIDSGLHTARVREGLSVLASLDLSSDGKTAALASESRRHPRELFIHTTGNAAPIRITDSNPWIATKRLANQELVRYRARDGLELEGILIRPLDEAPGTRYPLILSVHGGPEAHEVDGWLTAYSKPGQAAAARGFAVFYPNYRGSTGRGVAFSKLGQADYAGREFDDLVDAANHFVGTGLADAKRVGITGGSYGGYATAWAATRLTEHFAAGVMFVGISNHVSKSGTTDIPNEMALVHARKRLYGNWQWFLERSPVYWVENARTPLLILHGKEDTRVHPSQSLELYRHLKTLGKAPVRLVLYPGEGHGNRKSAARYDYNLRTLAWFEHYLKGPGGAPPSHELDYGLPKDAAKSGAVPAAGS
jgi:dipeptidyl aminopeptidase/acylaminoacyl peptidase